MIGRFMVPMTVRVIMGAPTADMAGGHSVFGKTRHTFARRGVAGGLGRDHQFAEMGWWLANGFDDRTLENKGNGRLAGASAGAISLLEYQRSFFYLIGSLR